MSTKIHKNDALTLELEEQGDSINVAWTGKSTARNPGDFLSPILTEALGAARDGGRRLTLDFRALAYMNSSTITPVLRMLHEAKASDAKVTILYDASQRWQKLSFSALEFFQTPDQRIEIRGV